MFFLGGLAMLEDSLLYGRLAGTGEIDQDARFVLRFAVCQPKLAGIALSFLLRFGYRWALVATA